MPMLSPARESCSDAARWTLCFAAAVALHVGGAAALLARWDDNEFTANPPVITIDLAPLAVAPETTPTDLPEAPPQVETPPEPEPPPPPQTETVVEPPKPPPPKPPEKKKVAKLTTAPKPTERHAPVAAAPVPGAGAINSSALPNWKSALVAQLERNKRYPPEARSRGDQGVAQLAFSIDRHGGVHNVRVVHSSGSSVLDQETVALAYRAQPLPAPPPEVSGAQIPIVVPIRYNIR